MACPAKLHGPTNDESSCRARADEEMRIWGEASGDRIEQRTDRGLEGGRTAENRHPGLTFVFSFMYSL
jgi:hypothetical protein